MKTPVKKKKSKENKDLKIALCDISNKLNSFQDIDKKLEELVSYCSGNKCEILQGK